MRKEDETYLFDYIRHLQNQVNQLTIALLTGNKDRLEYPKAVEVQPGERIPVGHLADDLLSKNINHWFFFSETTGFESENLM